ncbi:MAG: acetolactate synthase small subunit [Alicyclobacillaceae bacterium]|jgi:acetolactate synthase-1/3 small subunit|uniref:acetolactate synthase small subunit n=1 Tax=Alicyclobacillus sp. SP_1 TaxID=2942475 RepID=UPI002157D859|nr:acetolactate synthase small subunit [Alicyclobacillus sp. SP_1]MCY0889305.1 acetolactate synthase small subunit [Alicyclobacillaceae bacterium]MCY0894692.1 acetolactate synthase small subunit [Alicyclobacillaceae bacterium]
MNRLLSVIVNNRAGVLHRVTALFLRKGFNIQNITVGTTDNQAQSRMTIVLSDTDEETVEQVMKQLHKQIDVLKVTDWTHQPVVVRELVLIQVNSPVSTRATLTTLINPFRAHIIDVGRDTVMVEAVGKPEKVDALISLLRPYGIVELARTGVTALSRDTQTSEEMMRRTKENALYI